MRRVDFRSDTLTKPSEEMRHCMANAEVGDNFYGEDPTVRKLEDHVAELLGKEAALFVLSGTMGNLISVRSQVSPGKAMILSETSHLHLNETGHLASVCGLTSYPVQTIHGYFDLDMLNERWLVIPAGSHPSILSPSLGGIAVENTHNGDGGCCVSLDHIQAISEFAKARSIPLHMDGARLFNASISLGATPADLVQDVDSVSFCLSKGLAAPGGALIAGRADFIEEARHWRQMVGGGMRQAGIFAASGLFALRYNVDRLREDHHVAQKLAKGISEMGLSVNLSAVDTNIVMCFIPPELGDPNDFYNDLRDVGVFVLPPKKNRLRFVTHADVSENDIDMALAQISSLVAKRQGKI
ncbi:threonine aldolase family protein [Kiloniella antarctica]|uniref:Threonine aldolase family protein n=1 Tax=Kiloniella antarctica TaxID=1550907 RepID=A0ABW5BPV8_9PROT